MIGRIRRAALIFISCGVLLHLAAAFVPKSAGSLGETLAVVASGLILIGAVRLIQTIRLSVDPAAAEELETSPTDERHRFIVERSRSLAMVVSVFAEMIAALAATLIFGQKTIAAVLNYTVCAQCVIYAVIYRITKNRY